MFIRLIINLRNQFYVTFNTKAIAFIYIFQRSVGFIIFIALTDFKETPLLTLNACKSIT